jgi:hypothetical protein
MTPDQLTTLKAGLQASTVPAVIAAVSAGDTATLEAWCNTATATKAWNPAASGIDLYEEMDITKFDNISAGKRDAYRLMMDFAPVDFGRAKARKALQDIWGNTDSIALLQAMQRFATNGELLMGATDATTNTVTAKKLSFTGSISYSDIGLALSS